MRRPALKGRLALMGGVAAMFMLPLSAASAADRIVFLGNSLTRHGPDPSIDWPGDWGMAASRAELDYVSETLVKLQHEAHVKLDSAVLSDYTLEREFFDLDAGRIAVLMAEVPRAGIVVLQLGDNLDLAGNRADGVLFGRQYALVLFGLRTRVGAAARLVCVGRWWPLAAIDAQIEKLCETAHGTFVPIADVHDEPWGTAASERRFKTPGVGEHPGDRAMREIARRVAAGAL